MLRNDDLVSPIAFKEYLDSGRAEATRRVYEQKIRPRRESLYRLARDAARTRWARSVSPSTLLD
jgi:hypothetical protein